MEFSQSFLKKYSDPEKHQEMQDVISKAYPYCKDIKASDADIELMFESLYAFKNTIAERANINMDEIYPKLGFIYSISDENYPADCRAAGLCSFENGTEERPITVTANSKCVSTNEEYRKSVLIHEYCHTFSAGYTKDADGLHLNSTGLKYTAIDEAVNDSCAAEMTRYLGYNITKYNNTILCQDGDNSRAYSISNVSGYVRTAEYTKLLECAYGPAILYNDKFTKNSSIESVYGENHFIDMAGAIDRIQNHENSMFDHLRIEHSLLPVLEQRWDKIENYNIDDYIREAQLAQKSTTYLLISKEKCGDTSVDGKNITIDSISAYQSFFEIKNIYSQMKEMNSADELIKELNPATRSQDCSDFLIAMNGLKKLEKQFSSEDLWDMTYKRVTVNGKSALQVSVGEDKYYVVGTVDKSTGLTSCEGIVEADEKFMRRNYFIDLLQSRKITKDMEIDVSFVNMAEMNKYSKIYDKIVAITNEYDVPLNPEDKIKFIFAGENRNSYESIRNILEEVDISQIRDSNNNNLFHILAKNNNYNAQEIIGYMAKLCPEETAQLLNMPNNDGLTPLDIAHDYGNLNLLYSVHQAKIIDNSTHTISGNAYYMDQGKYISSGEAILNTKKEDFIVTMINSGMDINSQDKNGNTLLHLYVYKELRTTHISDIINKGANIEIPNKKGLTPLECAIVTREIDKVDTLLSFGANPNHIDLVTSEASRAINSYQHHAYESQQEILDILIRAGADPNFQKDYQSFTPLQIAAGMERAKYNQNIGELSGFITDIKQPEIDYTTIEKLIKAGADPLQETKAGPSLRDFAAETGNAKLFEIMIEAGVDKDILNIENSNLTNIDKIILDRIGTTVDIDLTSRILEHQEMLNEAKTADLDMEITKNSYNSKDNDEFDLDMD